MADKNEYLKLGDKVRIDDPASDKNGLTGVVNIVMNNGGIIKLDGLGDHYTPVQNHHLQKI